MSPPAAGSLPFLTPPQVAKRLAVKPDKVRNWIARGELRAVDLADRRGGRPRWRIDPVDLELFLAGRAAKPPSPAPRRRRPKGAFTEFIPL